MSDGRKGFYFHSFALLEPNKGCPLFFSARQDDYLKYAENFDGHGFARWSEVQQIAAQGHG